MTRKKTRYKQFTLIELVIVIITIGLLAGMTIPKFMGVQKDAKVSSMLRDVDTLEKVIQIYYAQNGELPIQNENAPISIEKLSGNEMDTIYTSLRETLRIEGDAEYNLYKIDLNKTKDYHKKTKFGHGKTDKDFYVYSIYTGNVYYYDYLVSANNNKYHTYKYINMDNIEEVERKTSESEILKEEN